MLRRAVALVLITAAGVAAPSATAAVVPLAPSVRIVDAALSGPDVLTVEETTRRDLVLRARPLTGGPAVTRATFRRPRNADEGFADVQADGGQVAIRVDWRGGNEAALRRAEVLLGPAAGPFVPVVRWVRGNRAPAPSAIALDAGRLAVAEEDDGPADRVRVREADGSWVVVPGLTGGYGLALRGDRVATLAGLAEDEDRVEVHDRTTGALVRTQRIDGADAPAFGPDGALAVGRRPAQAGGLLLADTPDAQLRAVGGQAQLGGAVRLTSTRAFLPESTRAGERPVEVLRAGGAVRPIGPRTSSLHVADATDDHVLWSTETCLVVAATGDPAPAALPPGPCARSEAFVLAVERGAQVTCLTAPGRGCRVTLRLSGRRNRTLGRRTVVVPVATTRTYDVPVPRRVLRRQPRSEDGRFAFVTLHAYATDPQGRRHPATEPEDVAIGLR